MSAHYSGSRLVLSEALWRPFLLLHIGYCVICTALRFLLPQPAAARAGLCPPFHHNRSPLSHLLSCFLLLSLNTLAMAHTAPWLWTEAKATGSRAFLWSPAMLPPQAAEPVRPMPKWARPAVKHSPASVSSAHSRDEGQTMLNMCHSRVDAEAALLLSVSLLCSAMWDMSACLLLLYVTALCLSLTHQLLFSPFTLPFAASSSSSRSYHRRDLLISFIVSLFLSVSLVAVALFAFRLHMDCGIELLPFLMLEVIRVAHCWIVMARGGRRSKQRVKTRSGRRRRQTEEETEQEQEEAEDEDEQSSAADPAALIPAADRIAFLRERQGKDSLRARLRGDVAAAAAASVRLQSAAS